MQAVAKAQQTLMEMEQCEVETIAKRRCTILDGVTLLEKSIKNHILSILCGHKRNKTMINI